MSHPSRPCRPSVALAWRFRRATIDHDPSATLTRLLASDGRVVTDGGGKVAAALNVIEGADHVTSFLAGVVRKGWTDDLTVRFDTINGLPGLIVNGPHGLVQTIAFEIEGNMVKGIYVVRNPDKLRHLAAF